MSIKPSSHYCACYKKRREAKYKKGACLDFTYTYRYISFKCFTYFLNIPDEHTLTFSTLFYTDRVRSGCVP